VSVAVALITGYVGMVHKGVCLPQGSHCAGDLLQNVLVALYFGALLVLAVCVLIELSLIVGVALRAVFRHQRQEDCLPGVAPDGLWGESVASHALTSPFPLPRRTPQQRTPGYQVRVWARKDCMIAEHAGLTARHADELQAIYRALGHEPRRIEIITPTQAA
jgi:hypothetical protein